MSSLDTLPQDQRAVLQLVLSRGRSYDQIAQLLKMNPASVRDRARAALGALGPETEVSAENRGQIADYLLGQLADPSETEAARSLLAHSPGERAWARVVASELAPLAPGELPEIPTEADAPKPAPAAAAAAAVPAPTPASADAAQPQNGDGEGAAGRPRSSRIGGIIVLVGVVIAIAVVLFFVLRSNGSSPRHQASVSSTTTATSSSPAASGSATTSSSSSTTPAKVVAQINLTPPHSGSKAVGIAEVLNEGANQGVAIVAQNVPPNSTKPPNAYAVWLYNSPTDARILGFVNPGVGTNGRLSTAGALPSNAKHYKKLIVTVETQAKPKTPGTIILEGMLTGL